MATIHFKGVPDFTVRDREFVVLTGPSGREVSSLVRVIAGLDGPSQGDVLFDERRMNDVTPKDRDVALVSHDYAPYPGLTVYENLAIGLKGRQFAESEIKKRIAAVVEELRMQEQLQAPAASLSMAERRFVGLARAMVRQPRVILFDRPFANLSPADVSRGRGVIAGLRQRSSATMIYATDEPAEALALGARTLVIDAGAVQQDAEAETIYNAPANLAVAKFFGDPPMNLVHGTLKLERDGLAFTELGEGTIALPLPEARFGVTRDLVGKQVVLGFRPEDIEIAGPAEGAGSKATFRALVERAEPRGGQTELYLRTGAHELICRTESWEGGGARRLQFALNLSKAELFGAENGLRLTPLRKNSEV